MIKEITPQRAAHYVRIRNRDKTRIFVVDYDSESREWMVRQLAISGYTVRAFLRATGCLRQLTHATCDLIIAEARMSAMDGLTFLKRVRLTIPWVPVLLTSRFPDVPTVVTAIKLGAEDFLEKPLSLEILVERIEGVLQRYEGIDAGNGMTLSKSEKKVLSLILNGAGNKEMAYKLHRSLRTVERHRRLRSWQKDVGDPTVAGPVRLLSDARGRWGLRVNSLIKGGKGSEGLRDRMMKCRSFRFAEADSFRCQGQMLRV